MARHDALVSILDNDLYKFTMQHVVVKHYKNIPVVYQFTNREKDLHLNAQAVEWLNKQIKDMENLSLSKEEHEYMARFPFFDEEYLDYLDNFRFKPSEQVVTHFDETTEDFELEVKGLWDETILYEVPLLALISEAYFRFTDKDWSHDGQAEKTKIKTRALIEHGCIFSEFGTRRRRDFLTHDLVVKSIVEANNSYKLECEEKGAEPKGICGGTSNVYLAQKYNVNAIGTVAHEFFMAISALEGIEHANKKTLDVWYEVYQGALGIALTDTFTTPIFLRDFDKDLAIKFPGVRQDSGNPFDFIHTMVNHYKSIGLDPSTKTIVFSDSLDVERALKLQEAAKEAGIKCTFGIGTSLTNDFQKKSDETIKSKALNIVIKLKECNGKRVIKLSDDSLKHSADSATINEFKRTLGIDL